jgi:ribonuclease HI
VPLSELKAHAYTDGASSGSRGPGGYGAVLRWNGKLEEISGGEQNTTNQRMELTAACLALETIDEGHVVSVYSDSSYLVNCMRRGWYKKWWENGWLNHLKEPVANRDLWERLLEARSATRKCGGGRSRGTLRPQARTRPETTGPTSSLCPRRWR